MGSLLTTVISTNLRIKGQVNLEVNEPPAKAGGFGLRLKAGLIGHTADSCSLYTTLMSSSGSGAFDF